MKAEEIHQRLQACLPDGVGDLHTECTDAWVAVRPDAIAAVARLCKEDPELRFDFLSNLSGVDAKESILVVYHLYSYALRHSAVLKVEVPKAEPATQTVTGVWRGANWFEREAFDLLGVRFDGHPDLRRLLLPEDWEGHPLRKDYVFPTHYGGIDNTRDYNL